MVASHHRGGLVFLSGAFLWIGNVLHLFPTFPFAGYATMLAGGAIFKKDNDLT